MFKCCVFASIFYSFYILVYMCKQVAKTGMYLLKLLWIKRVLDLYENY